MRKCTACNQLVLKIFSTIKKHGYNDSKPFKYWLRRILINTAIDNFRNNSKHLYHLEIEETNTVYTNVNAIDNLNVEDLNKIKKELTKEGMILYLTTEDKYPANTYKIIHHKNGTKAVIFR